jgi:hypothetical protein
MTDVLSQYGLAGVVITALVAVVVYQNRRIETLYEQRRQDGIENRDKYDAIMSEFSQTAKLLLAKLSGGGN